MNNRKEYYKQWVAKNRDKINEWHRKYAIEKRDKIKKYSEKYEKRKDIIARHKQWKKKHPEYMKQWVKENKEKIKKYQAQYYQENKERRKEYMKQYLKDNRIQWTIRAHNKKIRNENIGKLNQKVIQMVYEDNIKKHGTLTCYLCEKPILFGKDCLEHKIPLSRGGTNIYENLAIACRSCNSKKYTMTEIEYKEVR